ncbi:hypothetical protein B0H13DRAFT_2679907 [Mycena leptocephala]|nr:hypothetical protein B0H13DRAFT_2679907 [Mycena leptocephala]
MKNLCIGIVSIALNARSWIRSGCVSWWSWYSTPRRCHLRETLWVRPAPRMFIFISIHCADLPILVCSDFTLSLNVY